MTVSGVGSSSSLTLQAIGQMRNQLDDLQRQLGTGLKTTTYAGLGLDSGLTIGLRSQLNSISGYQSTINQVGVRLDLMQTALSQFTSVAHQSQGTILQSQYVLGGGNQTQDQKNTAVVLDSLAGMLNTAADGRYLFSGSTVDQQPVDSIDHILNGDGLKAGLTQIIAERKQADLGVSGLGRLTVGALGPNGVSLTEDAGPFGFKLVGATTAIAGVVVNAPSGAPQTMSVDIGGASPVAGDTIKFTFALPDGTSRDLTLTATNASPAGANQFTIGATTSATAANLQAALSQSLGTLANTELVAASAVAAGNDFFSTDASQPPQRVAGPPFDTATALVDGTADTVAWYQGDNATTDPRQSALARADQSLTVAYGARANEQGLRTVMQSLAVFAAAQFSGADPNGEAQYAALRQRLGLTLNGSLNQQSASDIAGELAGAQVALSNADDRHNQTATTLQNLLQSVQGAPQEQVAAQIMSLQTSLQATLQTTAMLLKTTILNYL
jgi:flagellin-like hook-associated protein FlgL